MENNLHFVLRILEREGSGLGMRLPPTPAGQAKSVEPGPRVNKLHMNGKCKDSCDSLEAPSQ